MKTAVAAALAFVLAAMAQDPVSVDDSDGSIVYYSPSGEWTRHVNQEASFQLYQNSDTFTGIQGSTITWRFRGSSIQYWGNTGSWHGPCGIELDGTSRGTVNSYEDQTGPPRMLYSQDQLDPTVEHTIVITVLDPARPNVCELDRFVIVPPPSGSTSITSSSTSSPPTSPTHSPDPEPTNGGGGTGSTGNPSATRPNNNPRPSGSNSGGYNPDPTSANDNSGGNNTNTGNNNNNNNGQSESKSTNWGVIGGAIGGGLAVAAIVAALLVWWCKRRKSRKDMEDFIDSRPTLPVVAMSQPEPPFDTRPLSTHSVAPTTVTRPMSLASSAPGLHPSAAYPHKATVAMPAHYPESGRTSSYAPSESAYGPVSPAPSERPLLTPGLLAAGSVTGASVTSNGRRTQLVLSAATELGESEPLAPSEAKRREAMQESLAASGAGASSSGPSHVPQAPPVTAAVPLVTPPVVQHTDAGAVPPTSAEELPPAYNHQWQQ